MEREFVTAVDPTDPHKGNRTVYVLRVYYDVTSADDIEPQDEYADRLAGVKAAARGCGQDVRNLEYHFGSPRERAAARVELQSGGFRFFCHAECLAKGQYH